ncbi:MAG: glycosyltransferase family 39 protein [Thermoguttaceae bacterium]
MSVNTLPFILAVLHRAGFGWELAGTVWNLTVSSLVVLPLFGWIRRQFDDRVATAACLLYAIHPKLIAWSPEIMRDPTFWLLFTLALYLLWRAATEVRPWMFVAAGVAISLACLTRFEGYYLFLPAVGWSFWRWRGLRAARGKLLVGTGLCLAVLPGIVLLGNLGWWGWSGHWVLPRLAPLARLRCWLVGLFGHWLIPGNPALPDSPVTGSPLSLGQMLWVFFPVMTRGLSPGFALLMFGGLWKWRRLWARRDHQVLFYTSILVLGGIWVQLWYDRVICPRYALPIVLMASPFAALGLLGLTAWWVRLARRFPLASRLQSAIAAGPLAAVCLLGVADAMTCNSEYFAFRRRAAAVAGWLRQHGPSAPMLVGPAGVTQIVGYYAQARDFRTFRLDNQDQSLVVEMVDYFRPDVVLLHPCRGMDRLACANLIERIKPLGLDQVDPIGASQGPDPMFVLVRRAWDRSVARVQEPLRVRP